MGSAICTPLARAGWQVRLWGTWLDDHLLDAIEAGEVHPRTGAKFAKGVQTFRSGQLDAALDGAEVVIMAVASVGVPGVTKLALDGISRAKALWLTSKGFYEDEKGDIHLLPTAIRSIAEAEGKTVPPIVAIAGPVKANECAAAFPTATIFGCLDGNVALEYARAASTSEYAIAATDDEVGVEICAPMKNVYAIALGIADGLGEATGEPHHNLKAAAFAQAVKEMSILGERMGAKPETAFGLPGVGDLEVTGLSGRNKVYGVRLGRGEDPTEALGEMSRLEQTVEGVPAAGLARKLVSQLDDGQGTLTGKLPLLNAINSILEGSESDVRCVISKAALPAVA
jgi:Glycerol-3-phosphate dehydrogenase